jgi:hypothetical protein
MKQSLMLESGWPNSTMSTIKDICQRSDVQGVIIIPWSV